MFQAMVALELKRRVPRALITGIDLPEWNRISAPAADVEGALVLRGHKFNLDEVAWLLGTSAVNAVVVNCWGQRLSYFRPAKFYRSFFAPRDGGVVIADDEIVFHIRAEDIVSGQHPHYYLLPFSYYAGIVQNTGLKPVFMGQLDDGLYCRQLKDIFPHARFLPQGEVMDDFQTLRGARHIGLSISTFCWLAAWLSESAQSVHMPVAGMFDPIASGSQLLPHYDKRYRFYQVKFPGLNERKQISAHEWAAQHHLAREMSRQEIERIQVMAATGKAV